MSGIKAAKTTSSLPATAAAGDRPGSHCPACGSPVPGRRRAAATTALHRVLPVLSERERDVLQLVAEGLSNRDIGQKLGLSDHTVKAHLARIGRKWQMGDRAGLVALGMRLGVIA